MELEYFYNIFGLLIIVGILLLKDYRRKDEGSKNGYRNNATRNTVLIRFGVFFLLIGGGGVYFKYKTVNSPIAANTKNKNSRNLITRKKYISSNRKK